MKKILVILVVLTSCTVKQQIQEKEATVNKQPRLEIEVKIDHNVSFEIKNLTDSVIYLSKPRRIHIEKFNIDSWESLKILLCPCDAPCKAPAENEELTAGGLYTLSWNKKESWCGTERTHNMRNTVYEPVENGNYRIKIDILIEKNRTKSIYKEFKIE